MKKMIAFLLALAMCTTLCGTAFANENNVTTQLQAEGFDISEYSDEVYIASKREYNGEVTCYMIVDNRIESKAVCSIQNGTLTHTDMDTGKETVTDVPQLEENQEYSFASGNMVLASNSKAVTSGKITYRYYIQGHPFTRTLTVKNSLKVYESQKVNLRGRYKDLAAVMAVFIAAFNLPAAGLKTVVKTILDRLGMAGLVTNIVIPDLYVRANEYEMTWTATYSKTTGSFTGSMYIVTQEGYAGQRIYGDNYFSATALSEHRASLAAALHDCIKVHWGDGPYEVIWN